MVFAIITVVTVLGLIFRLTFFRFLAGTDGARRAVVPSLLKEYAGWFGDGVRGIFTAVFPGKAWVFIRSWLAAEYPGWRQWVFWAMAVSFGYCAASGFIFALFTKRGLFGILLLAHVMAGALFAVSLAATVLLRARAYRPDSEPGTDKCVLCPIMKSVPRKAVLVALFWVFAAAGLCLIVTALGSMLPYFHFRAQFTFLDIHRYGALAALLAVMALFDFGILPRRP
jgi:hypothetical protein